MKFNWNKIAKALAIVASCIVIGSTAASGIKKLKDKNDNKDNTTDTTTQVVQVVEA